MELPERPSALLTDRQRKVLLGESDLGDRGERAARTRIRKRLRASIFDLHIIVSALPLDDLDRALSEPEDYEFELGTQPPLINNIEALPALLYLYHREDEIASPNQTDGWRTALDVEEGIKTALTRMDITYNSIDVQIEVDRGPDLAEQSEGDLADLSRGQLGQLHRAGYIDDDEFANAVIEHHQREDNAEM